MSAVTEGWFGVNNLYFYSVSHDDATTLLDTLRLETSVSWWEYSTASALPYNFIIDLRRSLTVTKVRGRSNKVVDPIDVDIYVSDDMGDWGTAVVTGISTWQDTSSWIEITTTSKKGRYVKVVVNNTELGDYIQWGGVTGGIFDVYCTDLPDKKAVPVASLMDSQVTTNSSSYLDCNFRIPWDGSKYSQIDAAYMAVNATASGGDSPVCTVELYDFTNSASLGSVITSSYGSDRFTDNLTMPSGEAELGVRLKLTSGTSCTLRGAVLWIILAAPENGAVYKIRLMRSVGYTRFAKTFWSTSYSENQCKRLLYTSANYDGNMTVYFGSYAYGSGTFNVELWNNTDSAQVAELGWTDETYRYKTSSSISLTNAKEYTTRCKCTDDFDNDGDQRGSHIIMDLDSFTKLECDLITANVGETTTKFSTNSYVNSSNIARYDATNIGVTIVEYVESCAKMSGAGETGSTKMYDDGAEMTNSQNDFTSTSYARVRGGSAVSEPVNKSQLELYGKGYVTTAKSLQVYVQRLIILMTAFDTTPSTYIPHNLMFLGVGQ